MKRTALFALLSWLPCMAQRFEPIFERDMVALITGDTIWGTVVSQTSAKVVLKLPITGADCEYPKTDVVKVIISRDASEAFDDYYLSTRAESATVSLELARWAVEYKLYPRALKAAIRAATRDPSLADAFRLWWELADLGGTASESELLERRMQCCRTAAQSGHEPPDLKLKRCRILFALGQERNVGEALDELWSRGVAEAFPDSVMVEIGIFRSDVALARGEAEEALGALDAVETLFPGEPRLYAGQARASFARGDLAATRQAVERCRNAGGARDLPVVEAAVLLLDRAPKEALEKLGGAGTEPEVHFLRGLAAIQLGAPDDARLHFQEISSSPLGQLGQGFLDESLGLNQAALDNYVLATEGLSGSLRATAALLSGRTSLRLGQEDSALQAFGQSIDWGCPPAWVLESLADPSLVAGSSERAAASLSLIATESSPDEQEKLGHLLLRMGRLTAARLRFSESLRGDSTQLGSLRGLLYVAYREGDREEIDRALQAVLDVDPTDPYAARVEENLRRADAQFVLVEDFARKKDSEKVLNSWQETEALGVEIQTQRGDCIFRGTSSTGKTLLFRSVPRKLARFEAELRAPRQAGLRTGIEAVLGRKTLLFFLDERGELGYRIDQSRESAAVLLGIFPESPTRLAIDLPDTKGAKIRLLINDNLAREVNMSGWKGLKKARVGIFTEAERDAIPVDLQVASCTLYVYR